MRSLVRLAGLAAGVAIVASCDHDCRPRRRDSAWRRTATRVRRRPARTPAATARRSSIDSPTRRHVDQRRRLGVRARSTCTQQGSEVRDDAGRDGQGQRRSRHVPPTPRYRLSAFPARARSAPGLQDTTVRRYLQPMNPADTTVDSLVVVVTATDSAGGADTATRADHHRGGSEGDGRRAEQRRQHSGGRRPQRRRARASGERRRPHRHSRAGRSELADQARHDDSRRSIHNNPRDITFSTIARIPINAPIRGKITVTATAVDVDRQPGRRTAGRSRSFARRTAAQPRVTQVVLAEDGVRRLGDRAAPPATPSRCSASSSATRAQHHLQTRLAAAVAAVQRERQGDVRAQPAAARCRASASASRRSPSTRRAASDTRCPVSRASAEGDTQRNALTRLDARRLRPHVRAAAAGHDRRHRRRRGARQRLPVQHQLQPARRLAELDRPARASRRRSDRRRLAAVGHGRSRTIRIRCSSRTPAVRTSAASSSVRRRRPSMHEDLAAPHPHAQHVRLHRHGHSATRTPARFGSPRSDRSATPIVRSTSRSQRAAASSTRRVRRRRRPPERFAGSIRRCRFRIRVRSGSTARSSRKPRSRRTRCSTSTRSRSVQALPIDTTSDTLTIWDHPYGQSTGTIAVQDADPVLAVAAAVAGGSDAELGAPHRHHLARAHRHDLRRGQRQSQVDRVR